MCFSSMEPLINSSMNESEDEKEKFDFSFSHIFNALERNENGSTSVYCGNSELIRVSLDIIRPRVSAGS